MYNNPYSIQIELSNNCTRRCKWCGVSTIKAKPHQDQKFMSTELATNIAKQLGTWFGHKRIEFALRGEPTLNPKCIEITKIFRENFPKSQLMITTNGDIIRKNINIINDLFDNGLNILLVDAYERYDWWKEQLSNLRFNFFDFYEDKPMVYGYIGYKEQRIILMDSIIKKNRQTMIRRLNNQGGSVNCPELGIVPLTYPLMRRCSNPFRELVIFNDGSVPICCMAGYKNKFIVGKTPEQSLKDIWNSDLYNAVRKLLYHKQRIFLPCLRCDYKGYRLGLLKEPEMSLEEAKKIVSQKTELKNIPGISDF